MTDLTTDNPLRSALFTDLYQLTMAQAYTAERMEQTAVFELLFRQLPSARNFVVAAGLSDVLDYLETFRFKASDLEYLRDGGMFSAEFLDRLADLRFTGDVDAVPEGTVVFPNEPLLRVTAPILEAQLVETFVLNQLHLQSILASKSARVVIAAAGRTVVDFGSRRAHGTDAAMKAARTSYLVGAAGTSNVLAGKQYGIPTFGTMAHSYIQAHDSEASAFAAFAQVFPDSTLLVDTYDTLNGVRHLIDLHREEGRDFRVRAIRLDSGDLAELARQSRQLLDEAGLNDVNIFASSGLDEYSLRDLLQSGAPIDGFGVGTNMAVCADAPTIDFAYKLVEYAGRPRMKLSSGKLLYPGRKQIFRETVDGHFVRDVIGRDNETLDGEPLLRPVLRQGQRLPDAAPTLDEIRTYTLGQIAKLPAPLRQLEQPEPMYEVQISPALERLKDKIESVSQASNE